MNSVESQLLEDLSVGEDVPVLCHVDVVVASHVLIEEGVVLEDLLAAHGAVVVVLFQDVPAIVVGLL